MGDNSAAKYLSGGTQNNFKDWGKNAMDGHSAIIAIGVILLVLAFIWLIGLSGVQTGSCTTSGLGSLVASSLGEDLTPNPTYEVISEFFIVLFVILGVGMIAYVLTTKRAADKLLEKGEVYSALIVNGKKDIDAAQVEAAEKAQLEKGITLLGLPVTMLSDAIKIQKDNASASAAATAALVTGGRVSDAYDRKISESRAARAERIRRQTMNRSDREMMDMKNMRNNVDDSDNNQSNYDDEINDD